jgi:hypothetical protein
LADSTVGFVADKLQNIVVGDDQNGNLETMYYSVTIDIVECMSCLFDVLLNCN